MAELVKVVRVLTERMDVTPPPPLPMPSLVYLMVDIDSLVPNSYTLTQILMR